MDKGLVTGYASRSQKVRIMSERWAIDNLYCAHCGNSLEKFPNNKVFADVFCPECGEEYELKCGVGYCHSRIVDGAYGPMIRKIISGMAPNLIYMRYTRPSYGIGDITLIPKYFFSEKLIIKRAPLSPSSRRPGWTGCFIDTGRIPPGGRIEVVKDGVEKAASAVIRAFARTNFLKSESGNGRLWLTDAMNLIETLGKRSFSLEDLYSRENRLQKLHPGNHNVKAKIRQQLQKLRDRGYLRFSGDGRYELV